MPMPFDYNSAYGNLKPGMMGSGSPSSIPKYVQDALEAQNNRGSMSGGSSIFNSILDLFNSPDKAAMDSYKDYFNKGANYQNPFYNAGVGAIGDFQKWLGGMSDPSKFINKTMENYQESPWQKTLQNESARRAQNMASASGLSGSTALSNEIQRNSTELSNYGMQDWLKNVLGINTEYGGGLNRLMQGGQHSADVLSELYGQGSRDMAGLNYNKSQQKNADWGNLMSSLMSMFSGGF